MGSTFSSDPLDWGSLFLLDEAGATRPLRLSVRGDPVTNEEAWGLFTASLDLGRPIVLRGYMGGQPMDVLWSGMVSIVAISQRVVDLFIKHGLTGWATYPVEVYGRKGEPLPGYYGLAITGSNVERDRDKSLVVTKLEPWWDNRTRVSQVYKGFYFKADHWDGSDFFRSTGHILITKQVRDLFKRERIRNVRFIPVTDYEETVPGSVRFENISNAAF